jgi:hypothetical protein
VIITDFAHLIVSDLGKPFYAEAKRRAPEAGGCFQKFIAFIVIDKNSLAARHDRRSGFEEIPEVGLRVNEARLVKSAQTVGQLVHKRFLQIDAVNMAETINKPPIEWGGNPDI